MLEKSPPHRVKGTAVFLTSDPDTAPAALLHNLKHNKVLHEKNVILTVKTVDTPRVERRRPGPDRARRRLVLARRDDLRLHGDARTSRAGSRSCASRASSSTSWRRRSSCRGARSGPAAHSGMPLWQDKLFISLAKTRQRRDGLLPDPDRPRGRGRHAGDGLGTGRGPPRPRHQPGPARPRMAVRLRACPRGRLVAQHGSRHQRRAAGGAQTQSRGLPERPPARHDRAAPRRPDRARLPSRDFWIVDGEFCGRIGLRFQRGTESLPPTALGHIGYSIVPWKRRRGYATEALRLILPVAREENLTRVLVTCDDDNEPSRKVILANGGVLAQRHPHPTRPGRCKLGYWVPTPDR